MRKPSDSVESVAKGSNGTSTSPEPERDAVMADSVGIALLVVLASVTPAERRAFVLHDVFGMPFDAMPLVERSAARRGDFDALLRVPDLLADPAKLPKHSG